MPTIPIGNRSQLAALPGVRQSGAVVQDAFMGSAKRAGDAAQALGQLSEGVDRAALRAEQDEAFRAETALKTEYIEFERGARQRMQGASAKGYTGEIEKWWKDAAGRYGGDLSPRAKQLASRSLMNAQLASVAAASRWEDAQLERSAEESYGASIGAETQRYIENNDFTPAARDASAADIRSKIAARAAVKGWTPEQVAQETTKRLSSFHQLAAERLLQQNPSMADQYLKDAVNAKELDDTALTRWAPRLKDAADSVRADEQALLLQALPYEDQLKKVAEEKDPAFRKKLQTAVNQNRALAKEAKREREESAADEAWQMVGQGKRVPEAVLARMDGKGRVALQDHLALRAKQRAEGVSTVKTDPNALAEVYDMMRDDPEGFKKLRMASLTTKIGGSDIEQIARLQRDMSKPDKEKAVLGMAKRVDVAGDSITAGMSTQNAKVSRAAFNKYVYDRIDALATSLGKEPPEAEVQKVIDEAQIQAVTEKGWFSDTKKRYFEMTPEERAAVGRSQEETSATERLNAPARNASMTPRNVMVVRTAEDYAKIPRGALFIDPEGRQRRKQ